MQTSATPVAIPTFVEEAAANSDTLKPRGAGLEQSSQNEMDIHAQTAAALHDMFGKLKV